jgi:PKD repeat protein
VTFTDASTGDIDSRIWSFGDGSTSTATNPTYTYATAGTYTVSLTVTGPGGSDTETKTNYITVTTSSSSLVAGFRTTTPTSGPAPLIVKFADASTGTITRRTWDFGDGSTTRGKNPKHIYYNAGTYTVSLTVKGPDGSDTETKPDYITVTTSAASSVAGFRATTPTSGSMPFSVGGPHGSDTETETGLITGQPSDLTARWTDYRVMLTMWSTDNDALGVIFRYQDPDNYYRFSWDKDRTYRQLVKQVNGVFTLLAEDAVPYIQNQTYQVEIVAQGSWLAVWIDGVRIFVVTDSSFMGGAIALYSWANTGSYFDNILVEDLRTGNILLWEDFADGDLTSWMIFDEGTTSAPSVWSATNGALVQSRNIYAAPIDRANLSKRGTFALYAIDNTQ